jgi:hypothetical protein
MMIPGDFITFCKRIPKFEDHPRKENPEHNDLAWFGCRYDLNGLMVWRGQRWVFLITDDDGLP